MGHSIKIKLRDQYIRKDGKTNFLLVVTINRSRKFYLIELYIEPKYWNGTKVLSTYPKNKEYNNVLAKTQRKAEQAILDLQQNDKELTLKNFEGYYFSDEKKELTIEKAYDNYFNYYSGINKPSSMRIYTAEKNKLVAYAGADFPLSKVDYVFYMNYRKYLIETLGNKQNTLTKVIKKLKAVINFSVKMGELKENKLTMVSEKEQESNRESLSIEELEKLEKLLESDKLPKTLKNVLIVFLFSCYTSVRFTDISLLTIDNIENDFIHFTPSKTDSDSQRKLIIPITTRSRKLIDKYGNKEKVIGPLFKVISNQKENEYLKVIMTYEQVNINRHITFHCARHTFAMNALNFGMPIEYVQKMLGHTKVSTTEIYAKYKKAILLEMADKYLDF